MNRQWLVSILLVLCSLSLFSAASAPPAMAGPERPQASFAGSLQLLPANQLDVHSPAGPRNATGTDAARVAGDEHWASTFTLSGVSDGGYGSGLNAMASDGHVLYIGGSFNHVDRVIASNIAKWDGTNWSPLGSGTNRVVHALALDSGGTLYAGGSFTTAGGVTVNGIAKWNGSTWSALGSGVSLGNYSYPCWGIALCVLALATDPAGNLYAAGSFTSIGGVSANNIAKWNGSTWSALGSGTDAYGSVFALAVDSSGYLYAGGSFTTAGGVTVNGIARWGDNIWSPLGSGVSGSTANPYYPLPRSVLALAVDSGGNLYAGGHFGSAGGVTANSVAKWSGGTWSALGPGLADASAYDAAVVSSLVVDHGGNLVAGTSHVNYSSDAVGQVARWNGSSWSSLGAVTNGTGVYALELGVGGELDAGGAFGTIGTFVANGVARWNGSAWSQFSAISNSVNDVVDTLLARAGKVYAGGSFHQAGTTTANNIALWNGASWSNLGNGMSIGASLGKGPGPSWVNALAQDAAGHLYAGGNFAMADHAVVLNIAQWDGSTWSALGDGVNGQIYALTVDSSGNLYAGGQFTTAGGVAANRIAKWNGSAWSAIGSGTDGFVTALAFDAGGNLYAGGSFASAGGVGAGHIAKWDGTNWSPLGSGMNNDVKALALDAAGNLYAGGWFTTAGAVTVNGIAKWDGSTWSALGAGVAGCTHSSLSSPCVAGAFAIAINGGDIYIGGDFTIAGGIPANYIAKWNGVEWSALGSGTNDIVTDLAVSGADLYATGPFWLAGGKLSENFALWSPLPTVSNSFIPVEKNQTLSFSSAYFAPYFSDVDGDSLNKIKITTLPTQGTLKLGATLVVLNQEIAFSDLVNLTYTPPTDWMGTTSFTWTGSDGTDYAASNATATLMVAVWQHSYFPWVEH